MPCTLSLLREQRLQTAADFVLTKWISKAYFSQGPFQRTGGPEKHIKMCIAMCYVLPGHAQKGAIFPADSEGSCRARVASHVGPGARQAIPSKRGVS